MRALLAAVITCTFLAAGAGAQVPAIVNGPRPPARVVDETGTLSAADRAAIERLAESIRATTRADLQVVVIPTTAGAPTRGFATDLFNRWRLGNPDRNDGLLLFVALADRRSEIILGDGLDTPVTRAAAQGIMDGTMIPHFRAGRPGRAILDGATRAVTDIVGVPPEVPAGPDAVPVAAGADGPVVERRPEPILEPLLLAAPNAELTADAPRGDGSGATAPVARAPAVEDPPVVQGWRPIGDAGGHGRVPRAAGQEPITGFAILLLAGGGTAAAGTWLLRSLWRARHRDCPRCGTAMILLGEVEDNARLEPAERCEEDLGSVDYRVWTCPVCPAVEKVRYGSFFTRYAKCPRCRAITKSQTVSRIRSATTYREGLERIDERCLHCGWEKTTERVIPRLPEPVSSSIDWSSGSSGGGFSGSSSGGGFSSGSSGGHSSGGGASGSW